MTDLATVPRRGSALSIVYTPWSPGISVGWTVAGVRAALSDHESGQFNRSAMLADAMSRDDRLSATLDVRIAGVLGLPFEMQPADEGSDEPSDAATQLAEQLGADWPSICPESELAALLRWYYMLGVGVAELVWTTGKAAWTPKLRVHHPQFLWYDETIDGYQLSTEQGTIPITPGDGKWVLLTDGERGYMRGLVRSLAIPWMVRTFAWRDWARHSERHGMPIMLVKIPQVGQTEEKEAFVADIRRLASETTIPLPQFTDGQGFDVDLLEAQANDWEGFERLITACNVSYAVRILGQNLTTEVQGGSYAAATAHERILGDLLRSDVQKLTTSLHQQVARPIVAVNSGKVDLTPWPFWNADPPEDQQKRATMLGALIQALDNAERLGPAIDTQALFEQFGIPYVPPDQREDESGKLFEYHFKYGTLTINEARARVGLEAVPDGDQLIVSPEMSAAQAAQRKAEQPPAPVPPEFLKQQGKPPPEPPEPGEPDEDEEPEELAALASADDAAARVFVDGAEYAADVAADGVKRHAALVEPFLRKVIAACESAKDDADLERRLRDLYDERDPKAGAELIRRARIMTQLAGRYAVAGET